jgi:hypothetical protein
MFKSTYFGGRHFGRRFFGKTGLLLDGAYNGARYFGLRYFAARYFGVNTVDIPQPLVSTNTPALSGVLGIAGNLVFGADFALAQTNSLGLSATASLSGGALSFDNETWAFTPPLEISGITGTVGVTGNLVITTPAPGRGSYYGRRFYGSAYFGPRYYGSALPWPFTITQGIGLSGVAGLGGGLATSIGFNPGALSLSASLEVSGDPSSDGGATSLASFGGGALSDRRRMRPVVEPAEPEPKPPIDPDVPALVVAQLEPVVIPLTAEEQAAEDALCLLAAEMLLS